MPSAVFPLSTSESLPLNLLRSLRPRQWTKNLFVFGALVFAQYNGRSDASKGVGQAPIYTAPRFETGDERYAWLNKVQAAAKGSLADTLLTYEMYELR